MDFATVEDARRAAGLSPTAMCRLAGVPGYNYWRARRGRVTPSPATLAKWAAAVSGQPMAACARQRVDSVGERGPLIAAAYRGAIALLAVELGENAADVASRPSARGYWKIRALALYCVSVEFDIRGADLARALGLSRQIVSWNLRQANILQDDPATAALVERAGRIMAAREEI